MPDTLILLHRLIPRVSQTASLFHGASRSPVHCTRRSFREEPDLRLVPPIVHVLHRVQHQQQAGVASGTAALDLRGA